ncbi:hypothetical protein D3C84_269180 [compost metagenome]
MCFTQWCHNRVTTFTGVGLRRTQVVTCRIGSTDICGIGSAHGVDQRGTCSHRSADRVELSFCFRFFYNQVHELGEVVTVETNRITRTTTGDQVLDLLRSQRTDLSCRHYMRVIPTSDEVVECQLQVIQTTGRHGSLDHQSCGVRRHQYGVVQRINRLSGVRQR